jgi:hypothetical protein
MNWLKHTLSVLGTMVIVVAFAAVLFPTRASALVATLIRDVDNPARDTFQATFASQCTGGFTNLSCTGLTLPTTNGSGAPISMVVIEFVSGNCGQPLSELSNYSDAQLSSLNSNPAGPPTTSTSGYFVQQVFGSTFTQQTRLYAAAGSTLVAATSNSSCVVSISGYLVTP